MAHYIDTFPGREILLNRKKYLYFGGTAYLGLQTDKEFQQLFINNVKKYGTNYGASRKSNIRLSIFEKAETYLSNLVESEACITLSSGYLAGQLVSQYLNNSGHTLFYAPNAHSALYQLNNDPLDTYTSLHTVIKKHLATETSAPIVLLDSIDFSGINYPDFNELKSLPLDKIILVVDDSHGIGIVGKNGEGVYKELLALQPKELIVCCSLGKGFGIQAGAIFGTKDRINNLKNTDFFGGASPATPTSMATLISGDTIYAKKREIVKKHINYFIENVGSINAFNFMKGHPSFSYSDSILTKHLEANGIIVTDFYYPSESSSLMSRIVLSASHHQKDAEQLTISINSYFSK